MNFAEEPGLSSAPVSTTWKILIADDEPSVHLVTKLALGDFTFEGRKLELISAYGEEDVKAQLQSHPDIALILLDVVMDTADSGFDLVRYIRQELKNHEIRIIMRTGQSGNAPEDRIIINYDINDFKDKTELTVSKLRTTLISSLRAYNHLKKIAQSRRYLQDIINSLTSVLVTVDSHLNVVLWNQQIEQWAGIPVAEAVGKKLFEIAPWLGPLKPLLEAATTSRKADFRRNIPLFVNGAERFIHLQIHPLSADQGDELVVHLEDVTVSRHQDEQRQRHQQLSLLRSLTENVAQELKSVSQQLSQAAVPSQEGLIRLQKLLRRIPPDNEGLPLPRTNLDWLKSLRTTGRPLSEHGRFRLEGPLKPVLVTASPEDLQRLNERLLDPASEGASLEFNLQAEQGALPWPIWSDSQRFWRLQATFQYAQKTLPQDLSWMISMVAIYKIVESLEGFVDAEELSGQQRILHLWLPEAQPDQPRIPQEYAWQDSGTVLVCDDEPMMLQVAGSILRRFGYDVLTARDGKEALELVKSKASEIRLMLLDLILPGQNGLDVFNQIHEMAPQLPVLLTSGFGKGDKVNEALEAGAAGFLQKPYGMDTLAQAFRQIREGRVKFQEF